MRSTLDRSSAPGRATHATRRADVPRVPRDAFARDAAAAWAAVPALAVADFHPDSSGHRPATHVRVVHHGDALRVRFDVADRHVLARHTRRQQPVCRDSCVELFLRPRADGPYFNFEFNCAGVVLCYCVHDPRRTASGLADARPLPDAALDRLTIDATFAAPVWPEITTPVDWHLDVTIPTAVFEPFVGPVGDLSGQSFGANFYKCADQSSHPHWASWSPIGPRLDFHVPDRFGTLRFL